MRPIKKIGKKEENFTNQIYLNKPMIYKHNSDVSNPQKTTKELSDYLSSLKISVNQKQVEIKQMEKKCQIANFKNVKIKQEVYDAEKKYNSFTKEVIRNIITQNAQNKQSPLFYNQIGLTPLQLILIGQFRLETKQKHICMVCYLDLEQGVRSMRLPCSHYLHKDCGVQHLLYSKYCPACEAPVSCKKLIK